MLLKAFQKTAAAVAAVLAAAAAPDLARAQAAPGAGAKTQAAAAGATGRATTDAPAATQTQGAAWAVKQATAPAAGAAVATPAPPPAARVAAKGDLVEILRASGQFTSFLKAAEATNLTGVLKNNQNLTVFAPTDAAFAALPPGKLDALMADRPQLQKLLTHHIVNARVDSSKIRGAKGPVPSVAGDSIQLDGSGETLRADGAAITQADVIASNGVLQVVDRVLTPGAAGGPTAAAATTSAAPAAATVESPSDDTDAKRTPSSDSGGPKR